MKKFGFTLAELVITLSIIGIVSALMAPAIKDLMPDKNKVQVTQFHTLLTNTIDEMFADESLVTQYTTYDETTLEPKVVGNDIHELFSQPDTELCTRLNKKMDENNKNLTYEMKQQGSSGYRIYLKVNNESVKRAYLLGCDHRKINTFIFDIDKYGTVSAGDALTDAYLRNPLNMNNKKEDLATAKKLVKQKKYN